MMLVRLKKVMALCILLLLSLNILQVMTASWTEWWSYEGVSGSAYWGLINDEWMICNVGKRQSPININPRALLYDPNLKPLWIDKQRVNGILENTGNNLRMKVLHMPSDALQHVNFSGGPLAYRYRVHSVIFHFGLSSLNGSEHTIDDARFPMEIQIMGYNSDIYGNFSQALYSTNGIAVISLLAKESRKTNPELDIVFKDLSQVKYRGQYTNLKHISIYGLLPHTDSFVTYEGSLTQPGCQETATWIIYNKPIYVSNTHLQAMRALVTKDSEEAEDLPKPMVGDNFRITQRSFNRPIRTNINFRSADAFCDMNKKMYYQTSFSNG